MMSKAVSDNHKKRILEVKDITYYRDVGDDGKIDLFTSSFIQIQAILEYNNDTKSFVIETHQPPRDFYPREKDAILYLANLYSYDGRLSSGNSNSGPIIEESFDELIGEWKKVVKTFPPALYLGETATVTRRMLGVILRDRCDKRGSDYILDVTVGYDLNDKDYIIEDVHRAKRTNLTNDEVEVLLHCCRIYH